LPLSSSQIRTAQQEYAPARWNAMSKNLLAELENRSEIDVPVEHPDTIVVRRYELDEKSLENSLKKKSQAIGVCQEVHLVDELLNLVVTESPRLFQAP
jgi:hypothetical protein